MKNKLTKKLLKSLNKPKKFNTTKSIKGLFANRFLTDGNLFITTYDLVSKTEYFQNKNYRAKIIVELMMSIETSLKSLILSLSKDDETVINAYKKAKGCSHDINKLYHEVKCRSKNRIKILDKPKIFVDIKNLKVSSRYSIELFLIEYDNKNKEDKLINKTINNSKWVLELRNYAVQFNNLASRSYSRFMQKHTILNGKDFSERNKELTSFIEKLK